MFDANPKDRKSISNRFLVYLIKRLLPRFPLVLSQLYFIKRRVC